MGAQRPQSRALGHMANRRLEPRVRGARLHRARIRGLPRVRRRDLAGPRWSRSPRACSPSRRSRIGLWAAGGRRAAMVGAWLLATNYVFVMWNRAALMESTMTAFIVAGWAAYAMTRWRPAFGYARGDDGDAGVVHEGGRRILRRRDRVRCPADPGARQERSPAGDRVGRFPIRRRRARRSGDARRPGGKRRLRGRPVRAAALDRLPLLQLADVGHEEAVVHRPRVDGPDLVAAVRPGILLADVGGAGGSEPRDAGGAVAMAPGLAGRTAARALAARRVCSSSPCTTRGTNAAT